MPVSQKRVGAVLQAEHSDQEHKPQALTWVRLGCKQSQGGKGLVPGVKGFGLHSKVMGSN